MQEAGRVIDHAQMDLSDRANYLLLLISTLITKPGHDTHYQVIDVKTIRLF